MTSRLNQHRRSFLQVGGLLGLSFPQLLRAEALQTKATRKSAKNVIQIWLSGGPSTIDMWDMKPDAPQAVRGEFQSIETSVPGLRICEHLPEMAKVMHHCSLIRSLKHSIPAHGPGSQYVITGHLPSASTVYPSLGSVTARMLGAQTGIPPYVAFGGPAARGAGYLGSAWNPFEVDETSGAVPMGVTLGDEGDMDAFKRRVALRNAFDHRFDALNSDRIAGGLAVFQQQAVEVLQRDSIRKALDLGTIPVKTVERYGSAEIGRNALRARRLAEAGVRFVTVSMEGWDTHVNNFTALRNSLLPQLDRALSSLIEDLQQRGMLGDTIICCLGEFGRTPQINGTKGRDHWPGAMSLVIAGGGFKPGLVYGSTDSSGMSVTEGAMTPADLAATILNQLGIDPHLSTTTASGRTMPIVRDSRILSDLVAS